jgi:hypothetical protein
MNRHTRLKDRQTDNVGRIFDQTIEIHQVQGIKVFKTENYANLSRKLKLAQKIQKIKSNEKVF